jgi:hypothetical protein
MRRAPRRVWWALAAAAAAVLVVPTVRPISGMQFTQQSGEVAGKKLTAQATPVVPTQDQRLVEIQIELAWLAEPITFPHYLKACLRADRLHVEGYVPNALARDEALRLARAHCPVAVIDEIKIISGLVFRPMTASPLQMQRAAEAALRRVYTRQASTFTVACTPEGRVTVAGTVGSFDEKLGVSRLLRYLPGCAAIVNQLRVAEPATGVTALPKVGPPGKPQPVVPPSLAKQTATPTSKPADGPRAWELLPAPSPEAQSAPRLVQRGAAPADTAKPPAKKAVPLGSAPVRAVAADLQARIASICGSRAMDVRLTSPAPSDLLVQFKVRDIDEGENLAMQVLALPELAHWHVLLDVAVAPARASVIPEPAALPLVLTNHAPLPACSASTPAGVPLAMNDRPAAPAAAPATTIVTPVLDNRPAAPAPAPGPAIVTPVLNNRPTPAPASAPAGLPLVLNNRPAAPAPAPAPTPVTPVLNNHPPAPVPVAVPAGLPLVLDNRTAAPAPVPAPTIVPVVFNNGPVAPAPAPATTIVPPGLDNHPAAPAPAPAATIVPPGLNNHAAPPAPAAAPVIAPAVVTNPPLAAPPILRGKVKPLGPNASQVSKGAVKTPGLPTVSPPVVGMTQMKEQIERVCGVGAMDVHVVRRSATNLLVHFKARSEAEGEQLAERVLTMPQLAPYHLDLDVTVAE